MAMNSVEAIINHSLTISNMIADEREQERKHALNPRCKPANYAGVAGYMSTLLESPVQQMKLKKL